MRRFVLLWPLALLVLQTGCTTFSSYSKGETQINQWVKEKQYGQALSALAHVDPMDPNYLKAADKRKYVEALAASYEHEIRQETDHLLKQGKWAAALDRYDEAMDRLPNSVVLRDGLARLHREQTRELDHLELERLTDEADWLKKTLPTYRDIARVDPRNGSAKTRLADKQRQAEKLADELTVYGNRALANKQLRRARQLLDMASQLSDAPAIGESLKKLRQQESISAKRERRLHKAQRLRHEAAERKRKQTISLLLKRYSAAFQKRDYETARKYLQEMADAKMESKRYQVLQTKLEHAIDQEASHLFDQGVSAYSRGDFEQAVKLWKRSLALKPENTQAQENLQRAERVLNKLNRLKQKQQEN